MANEEHLKILKKGVECWNQWRKKNPGIHPDLFNANLFRADFSNADLSNADLRNANLFQTDLRNANFTNTDCFYANLFGAKLDNANLRGVNFGNAILFNANLSGTDLSNANLITADLSNANLSSANLSYADLGRARLFGASFQGAEVTGSCIEDWSINSETRLDNVVCEYIFLKYRRKERHPSGRDFTPGEFTKLFQELEDVVELVFQNGLNWRAFAFAFNEVNTQIIDTDGNGGMFLREYKVLGGGLVALKVVTPPGANKTKIHDELKAAYNKIFMLDNKIFMLEGELKANNAILASVMDRLFSMTGDTYNNHIYGNPGSFANKLEGNARQQTNQYNIEQNRILIEVAQEIQQLYDQLLQTQSSKTVDEFELAKQLKAEIEKRPTLKQRFFGALKNGGAEALKELVNRSGFNILLEAARGWANPE